VSVARDGVAVRLAAEEGRVGAVRHVVPRRRDRATGAAGGLRDFLLAPTPAADGAVATRPGAAVLDNGAADDVLDVAPSAVAILCAAEDARAVGVAAATLLARRARASCGLVAIWTAPAAHRHPDARPPASRGARRLAAALASRGLDAVACRRAAVVALPAAAADAVAATGRAWAAAGSAPAVLVVGGPRPAAFDDLLAEQDRVVVVTRPDASATIAPLALAALPSGGPAPATCALGLGPVGRALAASGLAAPAALRAALGEREDR
jgi:hypothetical protein